VIVTIVPLRNGRTAQVIVESREENKTFVTINTGHLLAFKGVGQDATEAMIRAFDEDRDFTLDWEDRRKIVRQLLTTV
jgi:hypothetical protein